MKLYLIERNDEADWGEFEAAIVAAESDEDAGAIHPGSTDRQDGWSERRSTWIESPDDVLVEYIGEAKPGTPRGVVLARFLQG